ncbi:MAG TPA: MogA/MoaB family molybdenum cofactor biosynthesis protein [Actinomycetes bacterium]|nr:MogA/MoaB family molybdenum cofactor biosynthesis protein [Actinomycetes bacterium]
MSLRALAVTVSSGVAAGRKPDVSGPLLVEGLRELGLAVDGPSVVADGVPVEQVLRAAVLAGYDVIVTTGGTGLTPDDLTPEATRAVIDREVPGIAEAVRAYGVAHGVPGAVLSRGLAGLAEGTLVVNLAGSPGAVRDGLAVIGPVLHHLLEQARGRHGHPGDSTAEAP